MLNFALSFYLLIGLFIPFTIQLRLSEMPRNSNKIIPTAQRLPPLSTGDFIHLKRSHEHKRGKNWTVEEDTALVAAVRLHGSKWSLVAETKELKARGATAIACSTRYRSLRLKHAQKDDAPSIPRSSISSPPPLPVAAIPISAPSLFNNNAELWEQGMCHLTFQLF